MKKLLLIPLVFCAFPTLTSAAPADCQITGLNDVICGSGNTGGDGIFSGHNAAVGVGNTASGGFSAASGVFNEATGYGASAVGVGNTASGDFSLASGSGNTASGSDSLAIGRLSQASGAGSVAINGGVAVGENSIAMGTGSVANEANTVSVGDEGFERRIVNVADGTSQTDAVNVRQLEAAIAAMPTFDTTQIESRVDQLDSKIKRVEKTASSGVAIAMAMTQPVMLTPEKPSAVTAGLGHFNGQTAVGVAVTASVRPTVLTSFGAGFANGGKAALRAGISFSF